MAHRSLLCIEPDGATVGEIRRAFGSYGFRVESIPNGEQAIEWARAHSPALIILSVEPRKVGYAVCNKLKRSPTLREIPLILISSEETAATFEQHKKLKSRAEEYLLKPLDMADLLAKVEHLLGLEAKGGAQGASAADDSGEIEIADDEISLDDEDELLEEDHGFQEVDQPTLANAGLPVGHSNGRGNGGDTGGRPADSVGLGLGMLGDISKPNATGDVSGPSPFADVSKPISTAEVPFDAEQFDQETQAAFAALEAGASESGDLGRVPSLLPGASPTNDGGLGSPGGGSDMVDLKSLWGDEDLPSRLPWEDGPPASSEAAPTRTPHEITNHDVHVDEFAAAGDPLVGQVTPPPNYRNGDSDLAAAAAAAHDDALLLGLGSEVPPAPEEVLYDERPSADLAAKDQRIAELQARLITLESDRHSEAQESEARSNELHGRISSLESERETLRKELDEQRERMTQAASQGAFSKERDLLGLREIINKKEKDILDLRDALDAKERQILDHKDKIREHERARRDLEERTLGFEKSLVAANEKVAELAQDKEKSVEREKGLKARLDDAHEELRKGQDEIEALRKRVAQEIERGRVEVDKTRIELEAKFADADEIHRTTMAKATEEWADAQAAERAAFIAEAARNEAAHRVEVEGLQRRLAEEMATASERLQSELLKLRRDQEKATASLKEEQALQLASEREAYEAQTEAKHRAYRDEVMALRRRQEEELAAAEDRRQRDILEGEQRRVAELDLAEGRRRAELQARDEEHHTRVTDMERRHLIEKTEMGERHRTEHDQAVGRAVRAEAELVARAQEIEQAYRRLAGFEADLDAARAELGDRDVRLSQTRDRIADLEAKAADYEDQIVRAFQRLRTDEKTTEKVRRALAVGLALLDERAAGVATTQARATQGEEAEKS
jgi:CheY-like chemotaxis protein